MVAHPTARKRVITPVISGLTLLIPFITGVKKIHLLSGMSHQVHTFRTIRFSLKKRGVKKTSWDHRTIPASCGWGFHISQILENTSDYEIWEMMEILKFKPNMIFSIWNHPPRKKHGRPVVVYKKAQRTMARWLWPLHRCKISVSGDPRRISKPAGTVAPTFTIWLWLT